MMIRIQRLSTLVYFALLCSAVVAQDMLVFTRPTAAPTTAAPTTAPTTAIPTANPTTAAPTTAFPTELPSDSPSDIPSNSPSDTPSDIPSNSPSPSEVPSDSPSDIPSSLPSDMPSDIPSSSPSDVPSFVPTESASPSSLPTFNPTMGPTISPTPAPTPTPPTDAPTSGPTSAPTIDSNTVAGFILTNPDLSVLTTAYRRAGFVEPLSNPGTFTVFAPLDTAFAVVPEVYMAIFFQNDAFIPHLRSLLLHNILPAKRLAADFVDSTNATALSGENFLVLQNPLIVNGIPIEVADIEVANGVVHLIDDVLAPSWVFSSLQMRIVKDTDLSVLLSFMTSVSLKIDMLGEYTFLAPTNDAFVALGEETMAVLTDINNVNLLGQFLLYHILPGVYTLPELRPSRLDTFEGGVVTVSVNPILFNGVTVAESDILANNGVLHKINSVLFFENGVRGNTVLDYVADNPELSTLFGALQRSGFDAPLSQPASLTFFAPTNSAFDKLPGSLQSRLFFNDEFIPHLQDFLLYHILGGEIFSNSFVNGTVKNTLNQEGVGLRTDPFSVNGNALLALDIDVSNGVVHTVGGVLAPSWIFNSISNLVVSSSSLSILSNLMVLAGVDLSGQGALTLFAPTNAALTAVQTDLDVWANPDNVDVRLAFLAKHVVNGIFTSFRLSAGRVLPNIIGTGVVTVSSINPIELDGVARLVFTDFLSNNGVYHAIDTVLDPAV